MHIFIYACEFLDVAITFNHVFVFIIMRAKQDRSASYIRGYRWPIHNMWTRIPDVKEDEQEKKKSITRNTDFCCFQPGREKHMVGRYLQTSMMGGMVGTPELQNIFKYVPPQG